VMSALTRIAIAMPIVWMVLRVGVIGDAACHGPRVVAEPK
jgi:hypothetical protein